MFVLLFVKLLIRLVNVKTVMSEPNGKMLLSEISQLRQQLSTSEAEKLDLIQRFDSLKVIVWKFYAVIRKGHIIFIVG